jgi:hypothetical protein
MSLIHIASRLLISSKEWKDFLAEKYEGGKKKIPNPNKDTVKKYPHVSVNSALKDAHFKKHLYEEYYRWRREDSQELPKPKPPVEPYEHHKALLGEYTVKGMLKKYDLDFANIAHTDGGKKTLEKSVSRYKDLGNEIFAHKHMLQNIDNPEVNKYGATKASVEMNIRDLEPQFHRYEKIIKMMEVSDFSKIEIEGLSNYVRNDVSTPLMRGVTDGWNTSATSYEANKINKYLLSKGVKGSLMTYDRSPVDDIDITPKFEDLMTKAYAYQQAVFKHLGIKEITLYRGVSDPILDREPPSHGDPVKISARPASSWTSNPEVSLRFGGRVVKTTVSVERILLSAILDPQLDGGSALSESEFVVMGSEDLECEVFLHSVG